MGSPDRVPVYHLQLQQAGVGQHEPGEQRQGGQQQRDPRPRHHPHPGHHMEEVPSQGIQYFTPALATIVTSVSSVSFQMCIFSLSCCFLFTFHRKNLPSLTIIV